VVGGIFNLIAAILCTVGAALSAAAMLLSEPGFVNLLSAVAMLIATLAARLGLSPPLFRSDIESHDDRSRLPEPRRSGRIPDDQFVGRYLCDQAPLAQAIRKSSVFVDASVGTCRA
jgi:hypothetical protein